MAWLKGVLVGFLIELAKLLWAKGFEAYRAWKAERQNKKDQATNEAIEKKVEDAKSSEEIQDALDDAADHFGRR